MMKVLAIDPGYDRVGVAVVTRDAGREVCLFSNCFTTDRKAPHIERLFAVGTMLTEVIAAHTPTHVALEKLFFSNNQKTAMAVAEARGMLLYIARAHNLPIHEYTPQEIKVAMTGYGKSDKTAVIDMVKRLVVGVPDKAYDDLYDAVAVGVTCLAHLRA